MTNPTVNTRSSFAYHSSSSSMDQMKSTTLLIPNHYISVTIIVSSNLKMTPKTDRRNQLRRARYKAKKEIVAAAAEAARKSKSFEVEWERKTYS